MTPAGIEPATFRFVAEHLNHSATAVPSTESVLCKNAPKCKTVAQIQTTYHLNFELRGGTSGICNELGMEI